MSVNLSEVVERYHRALDAKPSKGPISEKGIAAITDSVADVPDLLRLVDEMGGADNAALRAERDDWRTRYEDMRAEAQRLGRVIERRNAEVAEMRSAARAAKR